MATATKSKLATQKLDMMGVLALALELTAIEQEALIMALQSRLHLKQNPLHPGWKAELERRSADLDNGKDPGIPASEVRRMARKIIDG